MTRYTIMCAICHRSTSNRLFGFQAQSAFQEMLKRGFKPDDVTLLALLCSCSHNNRPDEAVQLYNTMATQFKALPTALHHATVVDSLGRAGRLQVCLAVCVSRFA